VKLKAGCTANFSDGLIAWKSSSEARFFAIMKRERNRNKISGYKGFDKMPPSRYMLKPIRSSDIDWKCFDQMILFEAMRDEKKLIHDNQHICSTQ